jgi:O-antigen/teichoic acid export membrane protein
MLMLAVATAGLPESLTYRLARRPQDLHRALVFVMGVTLALGVASTAVIWWASGYLSNGDVGLAHLIVIAALVTVPALLVNALRGAATGLQAWSAVAMERVLLTILRLGAFVALFVTGTLTVWSALWVTVLMPIVAAIAYLPTLRSSRATPTPAGDAADMPVTHRSLRAALLSYGGRVWFGSVAGMLLARLSQLFMVPLSTTRDLGLFSVAVTISDVPIIIALAVQAAMFGVSSRTPDAGAVTAASRLTLAVGILGCSLLAITLPWWIEPLFGAEFTAALVPTWVLLGSAVLAIPGTIASSGLAAWGRPGLRSLALTLTLLVNVVSLFVLVPRLGVLGGCLAGVLAQLVLSTVTVLMARRVMGVSVWDFVAIRRSDVARIRREVVSAIARVRRSEQRPGPSPDSRET